MIVDGYSHCGISKYQPVEVLLDVMSKTGVDRALLCQHLGEYDNNYLAEVIRIYSKKFAAVCLIDPAEADSIDRLQYWYKTGQFKGVRLLAEWMEPYFTLWREAVQLGLNLVLYAPNGIAEAVPTARRLLAEYPSGRIVISHLGNPKLAGERVEDSEIFQLGQLDGVFVLISGLSMFCRYPYSALGPFISEIVRCFGSGRLMWGSNFPVCGDKDAYLRDLTQLLGDDWGLGAEEIQDISGNTANRLWFGKDVKL